MSIGSREQSAMSSINFTASVINGNIRLALDCGLEKL